MKIKSRTLPHSLYRQLKDEIKRRERRVLELEAALERITATHEGHYKQLQDDLATATASLAAAEAQIASSLEKHAMRDNAEERLRQEYTKASAAAQYFADLSDHQERKLELAYTVLAVIGVVSAVTAVTAALHYLPPVL